MRHLRDPTKSRPVLTFVTGNKNSWKKLQILLRSGRPSFEMTNRKIDPLELQDPRKSVAEKVPSMASSSQMVLPVGYTSLQCLKRCRQDPDQMVLKKCGHDGLSLAVRR
jgi:hypothetical protein